MSPDTTPPLDRAALEQLRRLQRVGAPSVLATAIRIYLEHSEQLALKLSSAMQRNDATAIEHSAHSWKSSSRHVGAASLASSLGRIETAARQQQLDLIPDLAADLAVQLAQARAALEPELNASCADAERLLQVSA